MKPETMKPQVSFSKKGHDLASQGHLLTFLGPREVSQIRSPLVSKRREQICEFVFSSRISNAASHGLSGRRARTTKSSRSKGPPTRSQSPTVLHICDFCRPTCPFVQYIVCVCMCGVVVVWCVVVWCGVVWAGQGGRVGGEVLAGTWLISPEKYCRRYWE